MIYFTAHTFKCVCHCRRAMFRVLGMYNFGQNLKKPMKQGKIEEMEGTFITPSFKSCYWGPFSGLKPHDLIKTCTNNPTSEIQIIVEKVTKVTKPEKKKP